ncbi:hypothetical protein M8J76_005122 [Diaphorina citri]|nr:hypothetical protein M8J76_005122 [Diaphorina citri]
MSSKHNPALRWYPIVQNSKPNTSRRTKKFLRTFGFWISNSSAKMIKEHLLKLSATALLAGSIQIAILLLLL